MGASESITVCHWLMGGGGGGGGGASQQYKHTRRDAAINGVEEIEAFPVTAKKILDPGMYHQHY